MKAVVKVVLVVLMLKCYHYFVILIQGFICPECMISFNSPEDLQIHFETAHAEPVPTGVG